MGLYGFGSAAHIAIQILRSRGCKVYVVTRGERQMRMARDLGAVWVGGPEDAPPEPLDRAVIFASAGELDAAATAERKQRRTHMSDMVVALDPDRQMVVQVYGEDAVRAIEDTVMY